MWNVPVLHHSPFFFLFQAHFLNLHLPKLTLISIHTKTSTSWQNLLELLALREQKLRGAGEIHRFHRDVAEALFRIQDKNAALSTEMGKDLNSALALHRKHEGFENDLVALEAQLQVK